MSETRRGDLDLNLDEDFDSLPPPALSTYPSARVHDSARDLALQAEVIFQTRISRIKRDPQAALLEQGEILIPASLPDLFGAAKQAILNKCILQCTHALQQTAVEMVVAGLSGESLRIEGENYGIALFQLSEQALVRLKVAFAAGESSGMEDIDSQW